ncbi:uncharacterized protein cubi_00480 [Cryptosporidium ubiquitum]|uniref:Uncharacterized protein n=1 Tax=Cryptosporidium ubiquitum TaxID=857276 RepID=A0A1J4MI24_9CRYT|nr:uncharacterized protein cubi_00480 [Cryptosporidium ubiquitum]OII72485.1 hypothetical protein cubi_00480 [Cryptosporidium ubiquitum]
MMGEGVVLGESKRRGSVIGSAKEQQVQEKKKSKVFINSSVSSECDEFSVPPICIWLTIGKEVQIVEIRS